MDQTVPSRRALIVDDEFLIAFDLESSMRELGFDACTVVSNERDAIELAKSQPPDVVVMDVYLGGTRAGIEAARWLREVCDVPIVFVTLTVTQTPWNASRRLCLPPPCCPNRFIRRHWLMRYQRLLIEA